MDYYDRFCKKHGITRHFKRTDNNGFRCVKCNTEKVSKHRKDKKKILVAEMGGSCKVCGYNKYIGALDFHHLDKNKKKFGFGTKNFASNLDILREEAKKCVLLCANCHREVEAGIIVL